MKITGRQPDGVPFFPFIQTKDDEEEEEEKEEKRLKESTSIFIVVFIY